MRGHVAFGERVYPSATAGHGERIGRTPFLRCIQCGCPNDIRKVGLGIDNGLTDVAGTDPQERIATSGCRFCGSRKWLKRKPRFLPVDSKLPAMEFTRHGRGERVIVRS